MQIIAAVVSSMLWSPSLPKVFVRAIAFISGVFTVNIPGFLSSVDCVGGDSGGMSPYSKWWIEMSIPLFILTIFVVWSRCLRKGSAAKNAVVESGVQVGFVWLFETIVTTNLKIYDCHGVPPGAKLILDPEVLCIDVTGGQIVSALILGLYIVVPYSYFARKLFRSEKVGFLFEWATEDYKSNALNSLTNFGKIFPRGFEIWNIFTRLIVMVGSTVMYAEGRSMVLVIIMGTSLFVHLTARPYKDKESNRLAIMFCVCDLIGAVSALIGNSLGEESTAVVALQLLYVLAILIILLVVVRTLFNTLRERLLALNKGTENTNAKDMFAGYSSNEKKFLFPVLLVVWVCTKIFHRFSKEAQNVASKIVKIIPTELIHLKPKEEKESDLSGGNTTQPANPVVLVQQQQQQQQQQHF